jgi:hypothetical protein
VGVVHSLQRDAGVIAVEVAVLDEVLDGIDNLNELLDDIWQVVKGWMCTFFRRLACSKRASSTAIR